MKELLRFLKAALSTSGLSGYEDPVRELIHKEWQPLVDELNASRLGSLQGLRRGIYPEPVPPGQRPSLLLAAHMDAIGFMVTRLADGFLYFSEIGGTDPRILPGQTVIVHGKEDLPGVIVQAPSHLLPPDLQQRPVPSDHLLIDTGLPPRQVEKIVRAGDLVSFGQAPVELDEDTLFGHSLDNRASVAALTHCLRELKNRLIPWDVWAIATVQEEVSYAGAYTSAYHLRPTLAVAVDVTFGDGPASPPHKTFPIGKGIAFGWGPNIHPRFHQELRKLADQLEIPYKLEFMPRHSGTDAFALQVAADGVPTMVVSIPVRYMHTPVEMVSLKDIARAGRLLAELASRLDMEFLNRIKLEEEDLQVSPQSNDNGKTKKVHR